MRKELYNELILIIGEDIPANVPAEFNTVKMYVRDENGNLNLYADISLPYLINYSKFLNIEDDPRYFFYEDYDFETEGCRYICEIIPFGNMKGVYRILNGMPIKIKEIKPLCEIKSTNKGHTLLKK